MQSTVTEGDKEETTYYFHGKGLLSQENSKGYLTYHFNNVGSTMAVTDAKGKVAETYNYTPYGELIDGTYSDNIPFLYNGQYGVTTDANGLYYMRARYYNVDIKRFVNQDVLTGTLERISSLNRYAYVEGNPVSYLDPFGLEPYDTTELHGGATILSLVGYILTLFPTSTTIGIGVSVFANGFDFGLYIYDLIYDIRDGNTLDILMDIDNMIIDLIGILTVGISNGYFKSAQAMDSYKGIMDGYTYELGRLFSEWDYANDVVSNSSFLYQIKNFIDFLKEKWSDK